MHVVFISNSKGKASARVRAVLDAYATRIGESAWATPITVEALDEVYKALKKGISRHTSVACYRNHGYAKMRLLWIIGNKNCYDSRGAFAPETRARKKPFPMAYRHAALIAGIAGYAHDLGKANEQFQAKIRSKDRETANQSDGIRHEWISAWLFRRLIESEASLQEIAGKWRASIKTIPGWMPVQSVQSPEDAVALLVATHHYAFGYGEKASKESVRKLDNVAQNTNHVKEKAIPEQKEKLQILKFEDPQWDEHVKAIRKDYQRVSGIKQTPEYWHGVAMVARAALILADHEVSSRDCSGGAKKTSLYANTIKKNGKYVPNQDLLWHLQNVCDAAKRNVQMFANDDLPSLSVETIDQIMERSTIDRFKWQDVACDAMPEGPALVFNVASTGAGKTRANVKLVCALRQKRHVRISSTFNLRTLTLQTFDAYTEQLGLQKNTECACLIGDPTVRLIHESLRDDADDAGGDENNLKSDRRQIDESSSTEGDNADTALIETSYEIAGADELAVPAWLEKEIARISVGDRSKLKRLLATPVLVSTIDFLNAAGDMTAANADWAHCLIRMAHSDLILDEVDSYDPESVVAVLRLVHIAAMFGRNVIISSATLSKTLAEYAYKAYLAGNRVHCAMSMDTPAKVAIVADLADPKVFHDAKDIDFGKEYEEYVKGMAKNVASPTKRFTIAEVKDKAGFFDAVKESVKHLHQKHGWELDGRKVSVGLVRVARIKTCINLAKFLARENIHVVAYHARDPLLRRAFKEYHLDRLLNRKNNNDALTNGMREHLNKVGAQGDAIFVVVATPVEEVGRDHDFDWAVIEPSSMHSIIQTAGRVNRHRLQEVEKPNIVILNRNFLEVDDSYEVEDDGELDSEEKVKRVFFRPGNEIFLDSELERGTTHPSHAMTDLLGVGIGEERPLDVRLMFGEHKTKFAECDEESIRIRLDDVITNKLTVNGHIAWFSNWFGYAYPLREKTPTMTFAAIKNENSGEPVKIMKYVAEKNEWIDVGFVSDCNDRPANAWLSPTIAETVEAMKEKIQAVRTKNKEEPEKDWVGIMSFSIYGDDRDKKNTRFDNEKVIMRWAGVEIEKC